MCNSSSISPALKKIGFSMISLRKCMCSFGLTLRNYSKTSKVKIDPGIRNRKMVDNLTDIGNDFDDVELDAESDFMDVHKSHREHERELVQKHEQLKYIMVKQKYFKQKFPNFLTWHDKEQMRYLYSKDPKEWSIEKLSESFPALPDVVQKILKSKFSKSQSKIKNHDAVVEKNWSDFHQGKLKGIPPDLDEHLRKFTSRKLNTEHFETKLEVINNNKLKIGTEFSDIITSYEKLKNKTMNNESNKDNQEVKVDTKHNTNNLETDTYLIPSQSKMKDKALTTLTELQENLRKKTMEGQELTQGEQILYNDLKVSPSSTSIALNKVDITAISDNKYSKTESSLAKKTERDYSHLIYPEKIVIPKELKKRGYTYRLNDCYYDYDGEFLYRVPGMN